MKDENYSLYLFENPFLILLLRGIFLIQTANETTLHC